MNRYHAPPRDWRESGVLLQGDEARHCLRVMRTGAGESVEVFDGNGRWARGVVEPRNDRAVLIRTGESGETLSGAPRVRLCLAIPKGKTMDLVVQKAVELGVAAIQPLLTERTVVRLKAHHAGKKQERWQRVALEACKQCGQNALPEIHAPRTFDDWVAGRDSVVPGLVASLAEGAKPFRSVLAPLQPPPAELEMLVGPEGDFSGREMERALDGGFQPVTLGEITLRVETAVLFCLSVLNYELKLSI